MKKVLSSAHNPYASTPTWTLTLSCGHIQNFSGKDAKDVLTRPPNNIECFQCEQPAQETNNQIEDEMKISNAVNAFMKGETQKGVSILNE